ncbi:MAG: succinate dehydrogenase assembly factor 2 [Rickettsiaceae bacterium]|nr:succinate dehydrogenase assembly factor 2 [Rickettsiaceae bacterium]
MNKNLDDKDKRLLYLCKYRGCKESEIIFGRFVQNYFDALNDAQKNDFEKILQYPDARILDWFMFKKDIPEEIKANLVYEHICNCLLGPSAEAIK